MISAKHSKINASEVSSESSFQRLKFQQPDLFHQELRAWWKAEGELDHSFADWRDGLKGIFLSVVVAIGYGALLKSGDNFGFALLAGAFTALASLLLVFNFAHDASHGAVFAKASHNYWLNRLLFLFLGIDGFLWSVRHLRTHHPYTNVIGADPDVSVGKILRVSPHQPHLFFHRFQALYAPLLYLLAIPAGTWRKDFYLLKGNNTERLFGYRLNRQEKISVLAGKLFHLTFWLGIPWLITDISLLGLCVIYVVAMALSSITFIMLAALNHFSEYAEFPEHPGNQLMPTTWSEHQLRTNTDWCAASPFITFWVGGTNVHVAHHLFPNLASRHLRKCAVKIRAMAERDQLPYRNLGFLAGVISHARFLWRLSLPEKREVA